jgi:hypothetical protein
MLSLVLPLSAAQADEEKGGDVDIPAPREATPTPVPAPTPTPTPVQEPVAAAPPIAAGIGVSWGEGVLAYEGVDHTFSVRGLSLLDVGASVAEGLGEVYNLESLEHFEGTYVAVEAVGAAGVGASAARMRNEHGVEISLRSDLVGVELALAPQSFSIRLK